MIYNGNWTEWSAIWSEIILVISKSNERETRARFEITSMISDQNCTTRSSIATLWDPFLKLHNFWRKTITTKFGISSCKILHTMTFCLSFSWNFSDYFNQTLKSDWLFCFTVPFSLAEKKMRFRAKKGCDSWINGTIESQSDCKDNQWFQNGFNKVIYMIFVLRTLFTIIIFRLKIEA